MHKVIETTTQRQILLTDFGSAVAYTDFVGPVSQGCRVLLNRTACELGLGTGGFDFVIAVLDSDPINRPSNKEHIVKLRYTPAQTAVSALESDPALADIWSKRLDGTPVAVCQLHSQIAHCCAAAFARGKRVVYVMTDSGCLVSSFSNLLTRLRACGLLVATISAGQAIQGDYESVTVHSALLAAKYHLGADVVIVSQGPGNAGTGTKYGFGGIEQASLLDTVAALGGVPIAVVRTSSADPRERHRGVSHHTRTSLELVRSNCTIPIPAGMIVQGIESRHRVVEVDELCESSRLLEEHNIKVTSMGRTPEQDPDFFDAASAAGKYAATL